MLDLVCAVPCLEDGVLRGLLEDFIAMLCLAPSAPEMLITNESGVDSIIKNLRRLREWPTIIDGFSDVGNI